jgi:hypothetical protein
MPSPTPRKARGVPRAGELILLALLGKTGPTRGCAWTDWNIYKISVLFLPE